MLWGPFFNKKSRIWETKHLSNNEDNITNTKKILLVLQNLHKKQIGCSKFTPFMIKSCQIWVLSFTFLFPKVSENLKTLDIGLWEVGENRRLNRVNILKKKICKKLILPRQSYTLYDQKFSNLRPPLLLFFPKKSKNLKSLQIGLWEVGVKKRKKEWETLIPKQSCSVRQNSPKNKLFLRGNFTPFSRKSF